MSLSIHQLTEAELEATDQVIMAAYAMPSRKESLRRHLMLQPQGCYVAKDNDLVIGFGAAIDYGSKLRKDLFSREVDNCGTVLVSSDQLIAICQNVSIIHKFGESTFTEVTNRSPASPSVEVLLREGAQARRAGLLHARAN